MLTTNFIRTNKEKLIEGYKKRNLSPEQLKIVDDVLGLDDRRKALQTSLDKELSAVNQYSKEIGRLFREGLRDEADRIKTEVSKFKASSKLKEEELKSIEDKLEEQLLNLPNMPHESVPGGKGELDNEVFQPCQVPLPEMPEKALPHWELVKNYNLIDLRLGTKLTGSGFPVYLGKGAKIQRALITFFLDQAEQAGYLEVIPPIMVNEDTARGTGQLPDKEGQMYFVVKDNLYLIPTAEVPLTNIYRNEILKLEQLPVKLTAYTPCFRREAGSYGADVKGLNRVHQFDKIEIVRIEHPNNSYRALDEMLKYVEGLLIKLELPYRILRLCGGDLGFTSALTFDFEVYSAGQKKWLEVSSVSNFETFQSNRMKLRFRNEKNKTKLLHTLNGSALALPRILAAILENNQTKKGIEVPKVLQKYTGFDIIA